MGLPIAFPLHRCRDARCQAEIIWAVTAGRGRGMPVNPDSAPDGTVLLTKAAGSDTPVARIVDPAAAPLGGWDGSLHHCHFETCPAAEQWRQRRKRTP